MKGGTMVNKKWKPVEFRDGPDRVIDANKFSGKCKDSPRYVAKCLAQYQKWRRGEGEYEWDGDPANRPEIPFCPEAIGIVEDAAIGFLLEYDKSLKRERCGK